MYVRLEAKDKSAAFADDYQILAEYEQDLDGVDEQWPEAVDQLMDAA